MKKLGSEAKFVLIFRVVINTDLNKYQIQATYKPIGLLLKKTLRSGLVPNGAC